MSENAQRRPPWSLRRRLVLGIVALIALISIVIGVASVLTLRQLLLERLDGQLNEALYRSQTFLAQLNPGPGDRPPGIGDAQGAGTIGLIARNGEILAPHYLDENANLRTLTVRQQRVLLGVDSTTPVTIRLGGALGDYRVITATTTIGFELIVGVPMRDVNATTNQLLLVIFSVSVLGLVVAAIVSTFVVRLALRPLSGVVATATRVAELELDRGDVALAERVPEADTNSATEVGQVGAALNRMLEHVAGALTARQSSERKVRQFVADASHELRTPLASIRGYSELTRRGTEPVPADVAKALSRIESESIRMTALVEELLLLARLDEGAELSFEPLDLHALIADIVDDARASSRDHSWELSSPTGPVMIDGDSARLHQALANLLSNARVHTPAGSTVTTTLAREVDRVSVTVLDDGPGIPETLLPNLFERFVRGDSSRNRGSGSTGLGLAITKAIIDAHGGRISVSSIPGHTTFTIELPTTRQPTGV